MKPRLKFKGGETLLCLVLTIVFALAGREAEAQIVTISPKTGNVIAAVSTDKENHLAGYGGVWVHNQLPMNLFTSDDEDLTDAGLPKTHANNIAPKGDKFVWAGGTTKDGFFTISLPRGYRFTGYRMVMTNNVTSADFNSTSFGADAYSMTERSGSFSGTVMATVNLGKHNTSNTTEYTLQRTSTLANDMGNILYFRLGHTSGQYAAVYVQSLEISFECDNNFTETVSPDTSLTPGVDCAATAFNTGRMDLGSITWAGGQSTGSANKAWRYNYGNVKDLQASLLLYDDDGVKNGTASTSNKVNGNIKSAGDGQHFALKSDVYYIETPTEVVTQNSQTIPVGYRITGCRLHYANAIVGELALGKSFYITDGNGKYLNTSLQFTTTKVLWQSTTDGYIYNGNTYLRVESSGMVWKTYSLTTTNQSRYASEFVIDGKRIYYSTGRSNYYITTSGTVSTSGTKATLATEGEVQAETNTYTLKLYGTDGDNAARTVTVNAENPDGELEVVLLNNDAVKFEVADLTGDAAYVYAELTLEALNPYISKTDVVGTVADGSETIAQSYLADDFTIGEDGKVNFNIPDNFASNKINFSFDNLTSKRADDTYGPLASDGYSRYHYVRSAYYDAIAENLQAHRTEAANHDFKDKVAVAVVGNQMFKVNNSDDFKVGTTQSSGTHYYTETRYTNAAYAQQGGEWSAVSLGKNDDAKACYLVTCDETRYNLAPTTTPRHAFYAYYSTNIKLAVQDYVPALTYTKVYDNAMLATGFDPNAYYGVKAQAKMKDSETVVADGEGYLFAKQILDQITEDAGAEGCPVDAKHILYIDASGLSSILSSSTNADKYGKVELLKDAIGQNALLYLPSSITYTLKNVASKTVSGDFKAENDIVLVDKQPFFAPYDIRVDSHNTTEYKRGTTYTHGATNYVSLVLPFTIDLSGDATHTNADGKSSFKFYTMQLSNAISGIEQTEGKDYQMTGHFTPVKGLATESNKPYLVEILQHEAAEGGDQLFVARQNGATIFATPTDSKGLGTLLDGATASGKIGNSSVSLTMHGAYNGVKLEPQTTGYYFYFNKNRFVSSAGLANRSDKNVYIMPFRTYLDYTGDANAKAMNISLEPNEDTTGISELPAGSSANGFVLTSDGGRLTIGATTAVQASIRNLSGQTVTTMSLQPGDTQTVALPAGIYLVNGVKVMVK